MNASNTLKKLGIEQTFNYIYKDPNKNMEKLMDWADKFSKGDFPSQRKAIREAIENPEHPYYSYVRKIFKEVDPNVAKTLAVNLFINAALIGWPKEEELREKYDCNIPWAILLDPTSACNLHCTGCWAAEYGHKLNLTYDEIDDIITQGKELGVYMYIYTGGEPLVRKKDLIRLCEKHSDCVFLCFTNATLIDEEFADEMLRVGNFVPSISLEGFEEATDGRRGDGVYQKVTKAMALLREKKLIYGISCCYTSANYESITSEEFYDSMIDLGSYFVWYFHYMPHQNFCLHLSKEPVFTNKSVITVQQSHCLLWISRMMLNMSVDVSPVVTVTCISMLMVILTLVYSFTILIPIFVKRLYWKLCVLQ